MKIVFRSIIKWSILVLINTIGSFFIIFGVGKTYGSTNNLFEFIFSFIPYLIAIIIFIIIFYLIEQYLLNNDFLYVKKSLLIAVIIRAILQFIIPLEMLLGFIAINILTLILPNQFENEYIIVFLSVFTMGILITGLIAVLTLIVFLIIKIIKRLNKEEFKPEDYKLIE
ncbi:MAG: hypothetical protein JXB17_13675 [Bacteroidales bacterium]|nr:hypothetical protein [Bacteroidales bacterium]